MSQALRALGVANAKRQTVAEFKRRARAGELRFAEVCLEAPPAVRQIRIADVVAWGWPKFGPGRQELLGKLAAAEGVNVLMKLGVASWSSRTWVTDAVASILNCDDLPASPRDDGPSRGDARLLRLIERAERERDVALQRVEELERQVRGRQLVMPTVVSEGQVAELVTAIDDHHATVTGNGPANKWAMADETLWAVRDRVIAEPAASKAA